VVSKDIRCRHFFLFFRPHISFNFSLSLSLDLAAWTYFAFPCVLPTSSIEPCFFWSRLLILGLDFYLYFRLFAVSLMASFPHDMHWRWAIPLSIGSYLSFATARCCTFSFQNFWLFGFFFFCALGVFFLLGRSVRVGREGGGAAAGCTISLFGNWGKLWVYVRESCLEEGKTKKYGISGEKGSDHLRLFFFLSSSAWVVAIKTNIEAQELFFLR